MRRRFRSENVDVTRPANGNEDEVVNEVNTLEGYHFRSDKSVEEKDKGVVWCLGAKRAHDETYVNIYGWKESGGTVLKSSDVGKDYVYRGFPLEITIANGLPVSWIKRHILNFLDYVEKNPEEFITPLPLPLEGSDKYDDSLCEQYDGITSTMLCLKIGTDEFKECFQSWLSMEINDAKIRKEYIKEDVDFWDLVNRVLEKLKSFGLESEKLKNEVADYMRDILSDL